MKPEPKMSAFMAQAFADAIPGPTETAHLSSGEPQRDAASSSASDEAEPSTESANSYESEEGAIEIEADAFDGDREAAIRARIEEALVASGLTGRELALAVGRVECVFHEHTMGAAAEGLAVVLSTLGRSPIGVAIRRRLTHDTQSIRDAAQEFGFSHTALAKAEKRLREMLSE